jgi:hypothetical protein
VKQLISVLFNRIESAKDKGLCSLKGLISSIWHGSIKWLWFSVLLAGAIGLISFGEFGGGLIVAWLSLLSLTSKYWHWAEHQQLEHRFLSRSRYLVLAPALVAATLGYFYVDDARGSASWSHVPKAWESMMLASTVRLEGLTIAPPPEPQAPSDALKSTTPEATPPSIESKPDIKLAIVGTKRFAVSIFNDSDVLLREPKYWFAVFNLTKGAQEHNTVTVPLVTFGGDWLRAYKTMGPNQALGADLAASSVRAGDVLFGRISATCPTCRRQRNYWLYYVVDSGGWYAEGPEVIKRPTVDEIISSIPASSRVAITDQLPQMR